MAFLLLMFAHIYMKYFFIFLTTQFLFWNSIYCQTVSYSLNYNDPYDLQKLKINLQLLNMDGLQLGPGLQAYYLLGKVATVDVNWRNALYYSIGKPKEIKLPSFNNIEIGGVLHIADRLKNKKLTLDVASGYNTKTTIRVPVKARKIFGLRAYVYNTIGYALAASSPFTIGAKTINADAGTTVTSTGLALGLSGRRIDKAGINISGYGNRRRNRNRELYADVFIGGVTTGQTKYFNGNTDTKPTIPNNNIGWRVGGQWIDQGTYLKVEFGSRPWPIILIPQYNYFLFSFGITVFGNEKGLDAKKKKTE